MPHTTARLGSLDAFRGATIAAMLLVNNPGSWSAVYAPLLHAPWHGWTPTDLIFPAFLWIVGVALTLSFGKRVEQGADRAALFRHAGRRAAIIFALGLLLAAFPFGLLSAHEFSWATLRIPGVLQRIAVSYLAASAIFLLTSRRGQIGWVVGLLVGYGLALQFVPVPGFGVGHIDEAKGNLAWWIDSHVLAGHTWRGAPAAGFDPEGILSTLPAIATVLMGVLAGHWLRGTRPGGKTALGLVGVGAGLLALGSLLDLWLPINKNLWTPSFAVFMAGAAQVLFGIFYWAMDVRGWRGWAWPFTAFGMNALALFVLSGLVARLLGLLQWSSVEGAKITAKGWLYAHGFTPFFSPLNASLAFAATFLLVHLIVAWTLWRHRWFLKV